MAALVAGMAPPAVRSRARWRAGSVTRSISDARLKQNISRTGLSTPDGIPIVEYSYNGKRWRGVLAQEVEKVKPEAVYHYGNGTLGVFYSRLGVELKEVL